MLLECLKSIVAARKDKVGEAIQVGRVRPSGMKYLVEKGSYYHFILTLVGKSGRQL